MSNNTFPPELKPLAQQLYIDLFLNAEVLTSLEMMKIICKAMQAAVNLGIELETNYEIDLFNIKRYINYLDATAFAKDNIEKDPFPA
jgi:hypothetical protein